jgi:hypothetical protein
MEPSRWLAAASLWIISGFAFPFLTPATNLLSRDLQQYLAGATGMSDELAYRVLFTFIRVPLTALLAMMIAATQCVVLPSVRPLARRWLTAAALAASVSVLMWLPTTLIAVQFVGETFPQSVRTLLLTFGAGLLAGLVCFTQQQTMRRVVTIPGAALPIGVLAAMLGALAGGAL